MSGKGKLSKGEHNTNEYGVEGVRKTKECAREEKGRRLERGMAGGWSKFTIVSQSGSASHLFVAHTEFLYLATFFAPIAAEQ